MAIIDGWFETALPTAAFTAKRSGNAESGRFLSFYSNVALTDQRPPIASDPDEVMRRSNLIGAKVKRTGQKGSTSTSRCAQGSYMASTELN